MKKLFFLTILSSAITATTLQAQSTNQAAAAQPKEGVTAQTAGTTTAAAPGVDDAVLLQRAKEQQAPLMVEKTGLTTAQAERVIEINFEIRQAARSLANLTDADRRTKVAELKALKEKKYSEIPLTAEQISSVYSFYEEMGKSMQHKSGN